MKTKLKVQRDYIDYLTNQFSESPKIKNVSFSTTASDASRNMVPYKFRRQSLDQSVLSTKKESVMTPKSFDLVPKFTFKDDIKKNLGKSFYIPKKVDLMSSPKHDKIGNTQDGLNERKNSSDSLISVEDNCITITLTQDSKPKQSCFGRRVLSIPNEFYNTSTNNANNTNESYQTKTILSRLPILKEMNEGKIVTLY